MRSASRRSEPQLRGIDTCPFVTAKLLFVDATVTLADAPGGMVAEPVMLVSNEGTSTFSWTPAFMAEPPVAKNARLFSPRMKVPGPV